MKDVRLDLYIELLETLEARFTGNMHRHEGLDWSKVRAKLESRPAKLRSIADLEKTGGEPDIVGFDDISKEYIVCDCSTQSPAGRRSLCYDRKALDMRKKYKPSGNAVEMAAAMGAELLTAEEYHHLQSLESVDTKTSSWLKTPSDIRSHGGAIFGDHRYATTFIYHNGADSYYEARGFRCVIRF